MSLYLAIAFSKQKRQIAESQITPVKVEILEAVDTIKIALLKLEQGQERGTVFDEALQKRIFEIVGRYNEVLRLSKQAPNVLRTRFIISC